MVAAVSDDSAERAERVPEPGDGEVCPCQQRTQRAREEVDEELLERVAVEGSHGTRRGPFVVHVMEVLVQEGHQVHYSVKPHRKIEGIYHNSEKFWHYKICRWLHTSENCLLLKCFLGATNNLRFLKF